MACQGDSVGTAWVRNAMCELALSGLYPSSLSTKMLTIGVTLPNNEIVTAVKTQTCTSTYIGFVRKPKGT
jgi:hypothetical protein